MKKRPGETTDHDQEVIDKFAGILKNIVVVDMVKR